VVIILVSHADTLGEAIARPRRMMKPMTDAQIVLGRKTFQIPFAAAIKKTAR